MYEPRRDLGLRAGGAVGRGDAGAAALLFPSVLDAGIGVGCERLPVTFGVHWEFIYIYLLRPGGHDVPPEGASRAPAAGAGQHGRDI